MLLSLIASYHECYSRDFTRLTYSIELCGNLYSVELKSLLVISALSHWSLTREHCTTSNRGHASYTRIHAGSPMEPACFGDVRRISYELHVIGASDEICDETRKRKSETCEYSRSLVEFFAGIVGTLIRGSIVRLLCPIYYYNNKLSRGLLNIFLY